MTRTTKPAESDTNTPDAVVVPNDPPTVNDALLEALLSPEAKAHRKALADDWSQYVAVGDINHGGVLAYPAGSPVPASNVKRWNYDQMGLVAQVDSDEGQAAVQRSLPVVPSTIKAPGDDA